MNVNKDIHVFNFQDFFNSVRFLSFKADRMLKALAESMRTQICRRYQLIIYDSDVLAFTCIFLTVCDNSVMTDFEYFRFSYFQNFSNELYECREVLLRDTNNPCIFLTKLRYQHIDREWCQS